MTAKYLTSSLLDGLSGIRHGFFTRCGGCSEGLYESLNCGIGSRDRREHALENRRASMLALGAGDADLCGVYQIHSADVIRLEEPWGPVPQHKADAIVTRQKNVAISILTADCAPVLFADPEAGVIGAAHAGWQGAFGGILENTVREMEGLGAEKARIIATVGPAIAQSSYEVGPEFRDRFLSDETANENWFGPSGKENHFLFDLDGYVRHRLDKTGIKHTGSLNRDTYSEEELFFSYRRTTHRHEEDYGRQISIIMLS
ncbi:peptidoglycan editing factor PgeF [Emcibacter sp.]|uniref:peptidoglycan editing factor PgeF n=1 Tax=Emcibacter sp. TaxID=1979954 RepID=UPI002AA908EE|nr:peptidoglycan editing factor PgeF [Emcibacter sp.]